MELYKKGDITTDGWEVVSVELNPQYKMRKRIKIIREIPTTSIDVKIGEEGYYYFHLGYKWIELDSGQKLTPCENDFEFLN